MNLNCDKYIDYLDCASKAVDNKRFIVPVGIKKQKTA